jgi:hypothetical protein
MHPFNIALALIAAASIVVPGVPAAAQDVGRRVAAAGDGDIRFSYVSRPGVCDWNEDAGRTHPGARGQSWRDRCSGGPVHVLVTRENRGVTGVRVQAGAPPLASAVARPEIDLGRLAATEAASYLAHLAETLRDGRAGSNAILGAVVADSSKVWPTLLRIARDETVPRMTRRTAVFWLGQAARESAAADLAALAHEPRERQVQEAAVFALARRLTRENVTELMRIARGHPDPAIRGRAIFWLGYSSDPRVLELFRELLLGPGVIDTEANVDPVRDY